MVVSDYSLLGINARVPYFFGLFERAYEVSKGQVTHNNVIAKRPLSSSGLLKAVGDGGNDNDDDDSS